MDVAIKQMGDVNVVDISGEIDGKTAPEAQAKIVPLTENGGKLLLDMTQVPFMSSAGLRMMLMLYRQMSAKNGRIALVGLSDEIKDTMDATGFLGYFTTCDSVDSALQVLNS